MERPETRYAWNGENALAYQVLGESSPDLVYLQGPVSNVELNWSHPVPTRFLRRLARGRRLIVMDPRGLGCSERCSPHDVWQLETLMDDVAVVVDACGSQRAAILASHQFAFVACMFAATYPERTSALIVSEASPTWRWSPETPWEGTDDHFDAELADIRRRGGSAEYFLEDLQYRDPTLARDQSYVEWWRRYNVLSVTPGSFAAMVDKYTRTDIRGILSSIHVPMLVVAHGEHHDRQWAAGARLLAERVPGAEVLELAAPDLSLWAGDQEAIHAGIDSFLDGVRREESELERVLATVLFTDIAGSTEKLAQLGNAGWRELVERHHRQVRALLERFRGTEVDTAGDGFLATFDGPARAIRCAQAIVEEVKALGLEIRAGLHTGECEVIDGKVGGMAVNIGARVGAAAAPSEVLVSQTVKDLVVGSGLEFEDRGEHELKGVAGPWRLYRVVN